MYNEFEILYEYFDESNKVQSKYLFIDAHSYDDAELKVKKLHDGKWIYIKSITLCDLNYWSLK